MFLTRRPAALAAVIAALTVGAPVALAGPATTAAADPVISGPSCPDGYDGPTNAATGCPYWTMSYTAKYPGEAPRRCRPGWSPPDPQHVTAADAAAACRGVAPAN